MPPDEFTTKPPRADNFSRFVPWWCSAPAFWLSSFIRRKICGICEICGCFRFRFFEVRRVGDPAYKA